MKYKATITGHGPEAFDFLGPELDLDFVIIFNEDAPPELAELSILHTEAKMEEAPAAGDTLKLGRKLYTITAVGEEVPQTLETIGHCTLAFRGDDKAYRPGCIMLKGDPVARKDVPVGETIEIF